MSESPTVEDRVAELELAMRRVMHGEADGGAPPEAPAILGAMVNVVTWLVLGYVALFLLVCVLMAKVGLR